MEASTGDRASAEEVQTLSAGTAYRVVLHPRKAEQTAAAADVSSSPQESMAPAPTGAKTSPGADTGADGARDTRGLSPTWFYVGAGVTAVLLGATIWSGVDTLSANANLNDPAPQNDIDDVKGRILRTDLLLAGTVVAAAATGYIGLVVVDWDGYRTDAAVLPVPGGGLLTARGRF